MRINSETFYNISKIIERDSKATTYKFALLRGVIDIVQDNSPFVQFVEDRVQFPTGLLIEKWLLYYYPIMGSPIELPQINGRSNLAFRSQLGKLINSYGPRGGFSAFYNDLKDKGIPQALQPDFFELTKILRNTITKMPMKYIGRSLGHGFYSIFQFENRPLGRPPKIDLEYLIGHYGTFSIPREYYEAFKVLGSFINGQDSLLFKWAAFSVNASGGNLSMETVLDKVLKGPITERNITESKRLYRSILQREGAVHCVWTGKRISNYDIDHVLPFSIWKNNDLWNLLPSVPRINNQKRDKIPSPETIERQKPLILEYWEMMHEDQGDRFQKEFQVALLGHRSFSHWKDMGIAKLQDNCSYLIEQRGFQVWTI